MLLQKLVTISVVLLVSQGSNGAALGFHQETEGAVRQEYAALATFEQSVQDYIAVHRRLARRTPPLQVTADPKQIRTAIDSLGRAIRLERTGARRGEVFTDPVARVIRQRIACAAGSFDVAAWMQDMAEDNDAGSPQLVINGPFPWASGNAMSPSIVMALPQLPEELEYRFVGADLVLVDIRANLVVDILEGALLSER